MRFRNYLTVTSVLVLAGAVAGCNRESTRAAGISDEDLEKSISTRIDSDAQLRAYDIDVDADAGDKKVTLSGEVPSQALRTRAVDLAKEAGGDLVITDNIKVDPADLNRADYTEDMARESRERAKQSGETVGDNLDDAWIHTKVRGKLSGSGELPFGGINVDVEKNVVTLRGQVDSEKDKAEAERLARETEGVTQVVNRLTVKRG
jgi:osmotically-inducible protein OsmY